ncbi:MULTISPECIES: c-type cytochrome [Mameliella]|nr:MULTISPECIES: cytochrome c [Mameliella]OWV40308.1 cytochrome C [Mameliella alba]OWV58860.1 cytochrome C [Mameliella alba]
MKAVFLAIPIALLAVGAAYWAIFSGQQRSNGDSVPASFDIAEGAALYAENCASCHGADLEGQPEWRSPGPDGRLPAPPHDESGHTWHHPDSVLFDYTKLGGAAMLASQGVDFESGMPGFGDTLTDQEIHNILAFIRSTWPERIREAQAERTRADEQQGDG